MNGYAIASLVCSLVWLTGLGGLLGIIFGAVSLRQIKESSGRQRGRAMALWGLWLGILGLVGMIVFIVALTANIGTGPTSAAYKQGYTVGHADAEFAVHTLGQRTSLAVEHNVCGGHSGTATWENGCGAGVDAVITTG